MKKTVYVFLVLFLVAWAGSQALYAEKDDPGASGQAPDAYSDPSASGEGAGSTLNEDSGQNPSSGMPHAKEVMSQDDTGGSDPSAFEGDTDSMPGERAPENLPMDDAPVDAGIGVR